LNAGAALPETVVSFVSVNGGDAVTAGGGFTADFTIEDGSGNTILIDELDRLVLYVSGPATNYQRVIPSDADETHFVQNADGSYTYTAADGFPTVYAAPDNDSSAFGAADGELTGQALQDGTYTAAVEARRTFVVDGESIRKAGDATFDFIVGGGTLQPRQIVTREACNACHVDLQLHGSNRFSTTGCVLCHINGAEDLISDDAGKETPGVTIQFADMVHRLHNGFQSPKVQATQNSATPFRYELIGRGENVADFSDVEFPYMPGGTGFNEQMRNCSACHGGAADAADIYAEENISQARCTTCHDDLDFDTGTILDFDNATVAAGNLTQDQLDDPAFRTAPGGIVHQFNDGSCVFCHGPGQTWAVQTVHVPPLSDPTLIDGLKVEITAVTGDAGRGWFDPGDFPVITFNVLDADDNPVPIDDLTVAMVISGPVENYQRIFPIDGAASTTVALKGAGGVPATGTGPFTYTSPTALPTDYPAPFNDSAAFDYAGGWGELASRADPSLDEGSYTVMIYATQTISFGGVNYRETSEPGAFAIRVGSAGVAEGYAGVVANDTCNTCHGDLRIHGNSRKGVELCVLCHTAGAEDRPNVVGGGTQAPEPDSIDFKIMIHKLHNARNLDVVQEGGAYDLVGFAAGQPSDTGNVQDFSTALLPAMPQEAATCTACHANDAWREPAPRNGVAIWMVACLSCHDSAAAAIHAALNTAPDGLTEACAVCHGDGAAFSVEKSHAAP